MADVKLETLGRYKIVDVIGRGAMGTVYKAIDPAIDRVVAIKTINLSLSNEELGEFEVRFLQEAKAAGRFTHPNIVTIFDVGRTEQVAYMAMEYLNGRELKELVAEGRRMNVETTVELIIQAADGLSFAHDNGIVHRDVKPSNIMVINLPSGVLVKITDFGIARMPGSAVKTQTGVVLGSPRYMSPEQVIGKSIDHRSDIFSLGVVLYETLTGVAPFDGDNLSTIMYAIVNALPAPPSTLNPAAPQMLDLIVAKALTKNVDDRYQGMREFASDLREVRRLLSGATGGRPVLTIEMPARATAVPTTIASGRLQADATEEEYAATLKLAKEFDSFVATMRLAALTQQTEEFREYISETQKMRAYTRKVEAPGAAAPGASVTPAGEPNPAPAFVPIPRGGHTATRIAAMDPAASPSSSLIPVVVLGLLALTAVGLLIALLVR